MKVFVDNVEVLAGDAVPLTEVKWGITIAKEPDDSDAEYEAARLRAERLQEVGQSVTRDAVLTGEVPSKLLTERVRPSTFAFLRAVHPGDSGFLELRAFQQGQSAAPSRFVSLPLNAERVTEVQAYARQYGATRNIYHAIATRKTAGSGRLENCSELRALYVEIDLKRGVPILEIWNRIRLFELYPSAVVHSGGGLHVYWLLAEPIDLTTQVGVSRAYQWLGDLAHLLGGEPESTEPARLLRVPDTFNLKPEYGPRPPIVTLLEYNVHRCYSLSEMIAILGDVDPTQRATPIDQDSQPSIDHGVEHAARLKLARAWLADQAPAVEGQGGDALTYKVCCAVAVGHDLSEEDTLVALREWNARCQPPWPDRELRAKVRNAIRYGKGRRGAKLLEFPLTEDGDAQFFAEYYGVRVRFDHRQGRWLLINERGIWAPDPVEGVVRLAADLMDERYRRAALIENKALKNWAHSGHSRKRLNNLLALARSVPPIADTGDNWDTDPWLLGVRNGVVDLRTGALRDARPKDRITMRVRVDYDPLATCPLWEKTISEIFTTGDLLTVAADRELIDYVQRALGYSLPGDCREECLFICWGEGANGKGTLMNTVGWLLADYANDLPFSALELHDRSGIPNDIAKLVGRRFVTASESSEVRLNEARVKALTGRDPITARFLHREFFTFQPVAKFWLATNQKPIVRDTSEGFWRRIHLIPFTQSFLGREDKQLKDKLRDEAAGILAWLVRGCLAWQRDGLDPPDLVLAETRKYREESDPLTPFFETRCVIHESARVQAARLYAAYVAWRGDRRPLTQTAFGKAVKTRFEVDPNEKRQVWYVGVGLRDVGHDDHDS